jgi:hypothetical protein
LNYTPKENDMRGFGICQAEDLRDCGCYCVPEQRIAKAVGELVEPGQIGGMVGMEYSAKLETDLIKKIRSFTHHKR